MRLIDADALLPMMKYATIDNEIGVFPIKIGFNAIAKVINEAPTVDAEPVRHGKWERHNTYHGDDVSGFIDPDWRCSECGGQANVNAWFIYDLTDYCPNCGAKMDAERKEE